MARYRIDPDRSQVWIDARSSLHPIHSTLTGVEGWFETELAEGRIDPAAATRGHVELEVAKMLSGNSLYDREMQRRVDARRYPIISGELTAMTRAGDDETYRVDGQVTFRGVEQSATDDMTVKTSGDDVLVLEGAHTFDIREFGLEPPRILTVRVHPDVDVRVALYARKEA